MTKILIIYLLLLKSYKRGLFSKLFRSERNNWKKHKISDFAKVCGGYAFNSKSYSADNGKYKILTIGNVTGTRYVNSIEANHINQIPNDLHPYQKLNIGDVIISMTGNVGRVSIVNDKNCLLNQRVAKLEFENLAYREIVFQLLSCGDFAITMEQQGQGAAQKNIKNSDIENYEFTIPPTIDLSLKLSNLLKLLDLQIENESQKSQKLSFMKTALLQQLFI